MKVMVFAILFVFSISSIVAAEVGTIKRVGAVIGWKEPVSVSGSGDSLYAVSKNGHIYSMDSDTGEWAVVGKPDLSNSLKMFAAENDILIALENDGTLLVYNVYDGVGKRLGQTGDWNDVSDMVCINRQLYSASSNGTLLQTDLVSSKKKTLTIPDTGGIQKLFSVGINLITLDNNGTLTMWNTKKGVQKSIGEAGEWKTLTAGAGLNGKLYAVDASGTLYKIDPEKGNWKQVGNSRFSDVIAMYALGKRLIALDRSGTLYRVKIKK